MPNEIDNGEQHSAMRQSCNVEMNRLRDEFTAHWKQPLNNPALDPREEKIWDNSKCVTQYGFPDIELVKARVKQSNI